MKTMMMTMPAVPPLAPLGYQLVLGPKMIAGHWLANIPPAQFDELQELCTRHDQDPAEVGAIEYAVIDLPVLTFTIYERNEAGSRFVIPGTNEPAHHEADVALRGALPLWWRVDSTVEVRS